MKWRAVGIPTGWRSICVLAVVVVAGVAWLGWPVWDSMSPPTREQAQAEAPWLMMALVSSLFALATAMWLDAGRRFESMSIMVTFVVANTLMRALFNPSAAGIEFVHALPLLAGMCAGAPAGFLVGASSALLSTIAVGEPATMLPTQALIWGLSGMLGGLLVRLRPFIAWLLGLPLAVVAGVFSGLLLNLMGWAQEPGYTLTSFHPGLSPGQVLSRLWGYTLDTSLMYDVTRGLTSATILALIGYPVLLAARRAAGAETRGGDTGPHDQNAEHHIQPETLSRRRDRERLDQLWNQGERR